MGRGRALYRNHLDCPSVSPSVQNSCPVLIFSMEIFLTSHNNCIWPKDLPWSWFKVIRVRSGSLARKVQTSCPVHVFLLKKQWKFQLHANIAYDLRVCHNLYQKSFGQVQGHWHEKCIFVAILYFFMSKSLEVLNSHKDCFWPESVLWPWPKVIWPYLRL